MIKNQLHEILNLRKEEIIEEACERYMNLNHSHYERISYGDQYRRISKLIDAFLVSLQGNREAMFREYIEKTGLSRIEEGYGLSELQRALWTFEDVIWDLIESGTEITEKTKCLRLVSQTIGRAKDSLANKVVEKLNQMENDVPKTAEDFHKYLKQRKNEK